ncbi:hypothetical protein ACVPOY_01915 [Staphylococcus aureus]
MKPPLNVYFAVVIENKRKVSKDII